MIDGNLFIFNDPDITIEILIFAISSLPKLKIKGIADYKKNRTLSKYLYKI